MKNKQSKQRLAYVIGYNIMPRKVSTEIVSAFISGKKLTISNSHTTGTELFLFGNKIAEKRNDGMYITNAGWLSSTTKERLNALPNVNISQRQNVWYLNGREWDGSWIKVG